MSKKVLIVLVGVLAVTAFAFSAGAGIKVQRLEILAKEPMHTNQIPREVPIEPSDSITLAKVLPSAPDMFEVAKGEDATSLVLVGKPEIPESIITYACLKVLEEDSPSDEVCSLYKSKACQEIYAEFENLPSSACQLQKVLPSPEPVQFKKVERAEKPVIGKAEAMNAKLQAMWCRAQTDIEVICSEACRKYADVIEKIKCGFLDAETRK